MTNPNLTNVNFTKTDVINWQLTTTAVAVVTNPASSNRLVKILSIDVANTSASTANFSFFIRRSSVDYYIARTIDVKKNSSFQLITGETFIYLNEGDTLFASSETNSVLTVDINYQMLSEVDFTYTQKISSLVASGSTIPVSGGSFSVTLNVAGYDFGTTFPYSITGVDSADINNASLSGTFSQGTTVLSFSTTGSVAKTFTLSIASLGLSVSVNLVTQQPFYFSLTATGTGKTIGTPTIVDTYANSNYVTNQDFTGYYRILLPSTRSYRITVQGANGGRGTTNPSPLNLGARIVAEGTIAGGTYLILLAGQTGTASSDNEGAGGGGGSFVALGSSVSASTAYVIAGGGGGSANLNNNNTSNTSWGYGSLTTRGKPGIASGFSEPYGTEGQGGTGSGSVAGFFGGGFNSNGTGTSVRSDGTNGSGFLQGATGGGNNGNINAGGFGGGGSGSTNCGYGGGGGGYSGGAPGGYAAGCGGHGGGGGSFVAAGLTQTSATNVSATYGSIIIEGI